MTQDGSYELKPEEKKPASETTGSPAEPAVANSDESAVKKPGDEGWIPPQDIIEKADPVEDKAPADPDVETHRGLAVLAYICFLIPLVGAPYSKFSRYHANQGLLVFILLIVIV